MGFDLAAAGLIDLFAGAGEAGAVDLAAGTAADVGAGAAADAGALGAADLAGAAGAADTGAGIGAADVGTALAGAGGELGLGGLGASDALAGAGAIDTGAATTPGALSFASGIPAAGSGGSAAPLAAAGLETPAAVAGGADPNIAAALDSELPGLAGTPTTAATLGGGTPAAVADSTVGGSGLGNTLSSIGGAAKSAITNPVVQMGLPLGMLGYDLIKGPGALPSTAQDAINNAQAGAANVGLYNKTAATDLNLANNFQISPAQAASIDQWKQNQYNQLYQQIANQGNTNPQSSSEWVQGKNQIDQQALAQQTQMINQLITTAFQAAGAANAATSQVDATLMQAAQIQVQQDAAFQQSVSAALQAFGLIAAFSGKFNQTAGAPASG